MQSVSLNIFRETTKKRFKSLWAVLELQKREQTDKVSLFFATWAETRDESPKARSERSDRSLISNLSLRPWKKTKHKVSLSLGGVWYAAARPLSSETLWGLKAETSKVASVQLTWPRSHTQMRPCSAGGAVRAPKSLSWLLRASKDTALFWNDDWSPKAFCLHVKHAAGTSVWGFQGKFFFLPAVVFSTRRTCWLWKNLNGRNSEWNRKRKKRSPLSDKDRSQICSAF